MNAAISLLLFAAPLASGIQVLDKGGDQDQEQVVVNDEISAEFAPLGAHSNEVVLGPKLEPAGAARFEAVVDEISAQSTSMKGDSGEAGQELKSGLSLLESGERSDRFEQQQAGAQSSDLEAMTEAEADKASKAEANAWLKTLFQGGESMLAESNRHLFSSQLDSSIDPTEKQGVLDKVAKAIETDQRGAFAHLSRGERAKLAKQVAAQQDTSFVDVVAPPPLTGKPALVPPRRREVPEPSEGVASFLESSSKKVKASINDDFQPASGMASAGGTLAGLGAGLPWGVGSPRTGDSLPVFHYSAMPAVDVPKEWEYSLDSGDNIQSFSSAQQDVKLITQVLFNVSNGFFLDTNAGNGEHPSNTLLLELAGWRGLIMEPRGYQYLDLWSKMRKAWLFLGCISPHENATKIGFDTDGNIDMLSGHMIHAYNMKDFMAEMGGRTTIDFWNLHSGGYEAEILNETLLGSGSFLEFGVILVRFDGRRTGRGSDWFVTHRSKDETEEIIFEILHNASFKYIGGLDAYWINHVSPRYHYNDVVWVNPAYFAKRGIPEPTIVKSAPPPPLKYPGNVQGHQFTAYSRKNSPWPIATEPNDQYWPGYDTWDYGYDHKAEVPLVVEYFRRSKREAASQEPMAKAHRTQTTKLVDYYDSPPTSS